MKIVFSDEAKQDLVEIGDFIARDSPARAVAFVRGLRKDALALSRRPKAFPILQRYIHLGIRRRVHGNYLMFYRIDGDQVSILRILHGARDFEALLTTEE